MQSPSYLLYRQKILYVPHAVNQPKVRNPTDAKYGDKVRSSGKSVEYTNTSPMWMLVGEIFGPKDQVITWRQTLPNSSRSAWCTGTDLSTARASSTASHAPVRCGDCLEADGSSWHGEIEQYVMAFTAPSLAAVASSCRSAATTTPPFGRATPTRTSDSASVLSTRG